MSAVFIPSLPVEPIITSSNAIATAPASRVLLDEPGLVARSSAKTLSFVFDLSGQSFNTVALSGLNLLAADTIRVRVSTSAALTSPLLDKTSPAWSGTAPIDKAMSYIPLPQVYTARYVGIDITTTQATIEVSRIIIGKRIEVDGIDKDAEITHMSGSVIEDGPGWTDAQDYRTRMAWKATAGNVPATSYYAEWAPFLSRVEKHAAFMFIPQTLSTSIQVEAALVRHKDDAKVTRPTSERYSVEMSLLQV